MGDETIETIRSLLTWALEHTDDDEVHYKLRTALQLLEVHQRDVDRLQEAATDDAELRGRLQDLGYLE